MRMELSYNLQYKVLYTPKSWRPLLQYLLACSWDDQHVNFSDNGLGNCNSMFTRLEDNLPCLQAWVKIDNVATTWKRFHLLKLFGVEKGVNLVLILKTLNNITNFSVVMNEAKT